MTVKLTVLTIALAVALSGCGRAAEDRKDQATLDGGMQAVALNELRETYKHFPSDESFEIKSFWIGSNGKNCGLVTYGSGGTARFVQIGSAPAVYAIKGREGWSDDMWAVECNDAMYELMKPS